VHRLTERRWINNVPHDPVRYTLTETKSTSMFIFSPPLLFFSSIWLHGATNGRTSTSRFQYKCKGTSNLLFQPAPPCDIKIEAVCSAENNIEQSYCLSQQTENFINWENDKLERTEIPPTANMKAIHYIILSFKRVTLTSPVWKRNPWLFYTTSRIISRVGF
jgi:hypothetical protein